MPKKRRVISFFLPDDDFVPDEEKVDAISSSTDPDESVKLPSDRILEEIRSKKIQRGQFGIGNIFWIVTVISFVCAAPNLFGWHVPRYWITLAVLAWIFTPGWVYISWWAANAYQYSRGFHGVTGLLVIMVAGALTYLTGAETLGAAILWIPQFLILFWLHRLFGKDKSMSTRSTVFRRF